MGKLKGINDCAVDLARRGWPVFPLHGIRKDGTCTCRKGLHFTGQTPPDPARTSRRVRRHRQGRSLVAAIRHRQYRARHHALWRPRRRWWVRDAVPAATGRAKRRVASDSDSTNKSRRPALLLSIPRQGAPQSHLDPQEPRFSRHRGLCRRATLAAFHRAHLRVGTWV